MAKARKTRREFRFKFGKRPAKRDRRNLKFATLLRAPVKVPKTYDFDKKHPGLPTPVFANKELGCCVISGRAHQTLRFELVEQEKRIRITSKDVEREYFKQTNGKDIGLVTLDSLKLWRKRGWNVGKAVYKINAFTEINRARHDLLKQAIVLNIGVGIGLMLPPSSDAQFESGQIWKVVSGSPAVPDPDGGHYVYVTGYTTKGPVCVTRGQRQEMTWDFFDAYCDEAYAIIDAINTPQQRKALDVAKLNRFLSRHPIE